MKLPTIRLAEIAERHSKTTPGEWYSSYKSLYVGKALYCRMLPGTQDDADFIAHAHQDIPYLLAQLTAAQERERMDAEIMREAIAQLDFNIEGIHTINDIPSAECWRCKSVTKLPAERLTHTPDCLVTKLRDRADQLGERTDG